MVFSLRYIPRDPSIVISPTSLYSPGLVGEYEHSPPSFSVPATSVQGALGSLRLCHFEL